MHGAISLSEDLVVIEESEFACTHSSFYLPLVTICTDSYFLSQIYVLFDPSNSLASYYDLSTVVTQSHAFGFGAIE